MAHVVPGPSTVGLHKKAVVIARHTDQRHHLLNSLAVVRRSPAVAACTVVDADCQNTVLVVGSQEDSSRAVADLLHMGLGGHQKVEEDSSPDLHYIALLPDLALGSLVAGYTLDVVTGHTDRTD